jgi:hypothetical protein
MRRYPNNTVREDAASHAIVCGVNTDSNADLFIGDIAAKADLP